MDNVPLSNPQQPTPAPTAPRLAVPTFAPHQQPHLTAQSFRPQYAARPPARQGAPASSRNFALSSAGGAAFGAGRGKGGARSPSSAGGTGREAALSSAQENKKAAWGESYVRFAALL